MLHDQVGDVQGGCHRHTQLLCLSQERPLVLASVSLSSQNRRVRTPARQHGPAPGQYLGLRAEGVKRRQAAVEPPERKPVRRSEKELPEHLGEVRPPVLAHMHQGGQQAEQGIDEDEEQPLQEPVRAEEAQRHARGGHGDVAQVGAQVLPERARTVVRPIPEPVHQRHREELHPRVRRAGQRRALVEGAAAPEVQQRPPVAQRVRGHLPRHRQRQQRQRRRRSAQQRRARQLRAARHASTPRPLHPLRSARGARAQRPGLPLARHSAPRGGTCTCTVPVAHTLARRHAGLRRLVPNSNAVGASFAAWCKRDLPGWAGGRAEAGAAQTSS
eukprot:scaffold3068_cov401-Prasinococcus_capsulatus_cf.AAC.54